MAFSASIVSRVFREHCKWFCEFLAKSGRKRERRVFRRFFREELESRLAMAIDVGVIKDINIVPLESSPTHLVRMADSVFFVASRPGTTNRELWKSDLTAGGTSMVRVINEGSWASSNYTGVGNQVFFSSGEGFIGSELWKSDGTGAGTVLVRDIRGSGGSYPSNFTDVGGVLFFTANDGVNGVELWKSDGTASGTVMVKDIQVGSAGSSPSYLKNVGGVLYFGANDGSAGNELWKSDGTSAGTVRVTDIRSGVGGSDPKGFTEFGGAVYFTANDGTNGVELWRTDGTEAGTILFKDIRAGASGTFIGNMVSANGYLYFDANDGVNGQELWKTNGTSAGTVMVKDIRLGLDGSSPSKLTNVDSVLYFSAWDPVNGRELWRSDGSTEGTFLLKNIRSGSADAMLYELTSFKGLLYFSAYDGVRQGLWKSDGTSAGTVPVMDVVSQDNVRVPASLMNINGVLVFSATNTMVGRELWKSDGTSAGTVLIRDIVPGTKVSMPQYLTNVNGSLYFSADDGVNGRELWVSNGTPEGTRIVRDIGKDRYSGIGFPGSDPKNFERVEDWLYFTANDGTNGFELWKTDGSEAGTILVKNIASDSPTDLPMSGSPKNLTNVSGVLFFSAWDSAGGRELWKSDGTEIGTVRVKDIVVGGGISSSYPEKLTNVNGTLFFTASTSASGREWWRSDGTVEGTVMIKDIFAGSSSSVGNYTAATNHNGTLYFNATDGVNGYELWKSDGTATGTVMVRNVNTSTNSSHPSGLTTIGSTLYFSATDATNGRELWKTDGTEAGTTLLKNIVAGVSGSFPTSLVAVDNQLYFLATESATGEELWKSDGTTSGTVRVKDVNMGATGSGITSMTALEDKLYFVANDGVAGSFMVSDGTDSGTVRLSTLATATVPVWPRRLTVVGSTLFFEKDELWGVKKISVQVTPSSILENAGANVLVGDLSTTGVIGGGSFEYSLVAGTGDTSNVLFEIIGTQLRVKGSLDFEANATHRIRVRSSYASGFVDEVLSISVLDTNETPTDIGLSSSSIPENSGVNALVGAFSTTDPDAGNTFSYSLVAGTGDADNAAFNIDGSNLRANASFDFETKSFYTVRVRSTDQGGLFTEKVFTINVADGFEGVLLNGTVENDTFIATYTGAETVHSWSVTRNGVNVFTGSISSGSMMIDGLGGVDIVQVVGRTTNDLFHVTDSQIGTNGAFTQLVSIEALRILGGSGDDNLNVLSGAPVGVTRAFDGGLGVDTIRGGASNATWNITASATGNLNSPNNLSFVATESLVGGSGNDQFVFGATGVLTGQVLGGDGSDSISFAAKATAQTVNLQLNTATSTGGIGGIETFFGGSGATALDVFIGANSATSWSVTGANVGTLSSTPTGVVAFSGFESLTGGTAEDSFVFTNTGSLTGVLTGGTATGVVDRVDLSARVAELPLDFRIDATTSRVPGVIGENYTGIEAIIGNLSTASKITRVNDVATAWTINSLGQIVVNNVKYSRVLMIVGNSGIQPDTLTGPGVRSVWTITGANEGRVSIPAEIIAFKGIENITGGVAEDIFGFAPTASISGILSGGTAVGVVDKVFLNGRTVPLDFRLDTTTNKVPGAIEGNYTGIEEFLGTSDTVAGSKVTRVNNVATAWAVNTDGGIVVGGVNYKAVGAIAGNIGTLADTLTGPAADSVWTVSGASSGSLVVGGRTVTFTGVENLTGSTAQDQFEILPSGSISGSVNGGTGTGVNSLSYAQWATSVTVNLGVTTVSNATAIVGLTSNIQMVTGGSGNDILTGLASKATILVGLAGNDRLVGGSQRDMLFGGTGVDTIQGGGGDDLLISGTSGYETDRTALFLIFAEWTSTRTFAQRTANIWGNGSGSRANGDKFLNNKSADSIPDTVFADSDLQDLLTGGLNQDWFFGLASEISDFNGASTTPDRRDLES